MDETPQAKFEDSREWGAFHVDCQSDGFVPVSTVLQAEGDRLLLRCNACGATGWHAVSVAAAIRAQGSKT